MALTHFPQDVYLRLAFYLILFDKKEIEKKDKRTKLQVNTP